MHARRPTTSRGFTLTELLISIALVLVLIGAVAQIFGTVSRTIAVGNAVGQTTRGLDAVRTAMAIDFTGTETIAYDPSRSTGGILPAAQQPHIIISSIRTAAFPNADADVNNPTVVADAPTNNLIARSTAIRTIDDGQGGTFTIPRNILEGNRNFRLDTVSFFSRGLFRSQVGLPPGDSVTSDIAWIWYGHGRLWNGIVPALPFWSGYGHPGDPTTPDRTGTPAFTNAPNSNNLFASQFGLVRQATLLVEPIDVGLIRPVVVSASGNYPRYLSRNWQYPQEPSASAATTPLTDTAAVRRYNGTDNDPVQAESPGNAYNLADGLTDIAAIGLPDFYERATFVQLERPEVWWRQSMTHPTAPQRRLERFWTQNTAVPPFDANDADRRANFLLAGATQVIVEYAGNFVTQAPGTGAIIAPTPDPTGTVDFTVDPSGARHIRWYGYPRDVTGDGVIPGGAGNIDSLDVRPLRDWLGAEQSFEKAVPIQRANYGIDGPNNNAEEFAKYIVAWGPAELNNPVPAEVRRPALIRIVVEAIDADGRLDEPIPMELVFRIPAD